MTEPAKAPDGEALPDWDAAANDAIAACNGNARGWFHRGEEAT